MWHLSRYTRLLTHSSVRGAVAVAVVVVVVVASIHSARLSDSSRRMQAPIDATTEVP